MATLSDKLAKAKARSRLVKGADGVLVEETPDLQALTAKAGLPAAPVDAASAATLGATPDQVKMVGTPAQVGNALRMSQAPGTSLATAVRTGTAAPATASADTKASQDKAAALADLGDTGARVATLVEAAKARLAAPAAAAPVPTVAEGTDPKVQTALATLAANPGDLVALAEVNKALGRDTTSQLTAQEISDLYGSGIDATAAAGAQALSGTGTITVADLAADPEFGYDPATLGELLGIPEAEIAGYTVSQLQQAVAAVADAEFSAAAQTDADAGSTVLGTAERDAARSAGRDASTLGIRATEEDMQALEESLASSATVSFAGVPMSIEEMLSSDKISSVITEYLQAAPGSPTRENLDQTEPELALYIAQHQAALSAATAQMGETAETLSGIQTGNAEIGKLSGGGVLPDSFLANVVPGFSETGIAVEALDRSSVPVLTYLDTLQPRQQKLAADILQTLPPDMQKELAGLTQEEIASLELDKGENSPAVKQLRSSLLAYQDLEDTSSSDHDRIMSLFTGGEFTSLSGVQKAATDLYAAAALGLATYGTASGYDKDKDGVIDDPSSFLASMKADTPRPTLAGAVSGKNGAYRAQDFSELRTDSLSPAAQSVYTALRGAALDGKVDAAEFRKSPLMRDPDTLRAIVSEGLATKLGPDILSLAKGKIADFATAASRTITAKAPAYPNLAQTLAKARAPSDLAQRVDNFDAVLSTLDTNISRLRDEIALAPAGKVDKVHLQAAYDKLLDQKATVAAHRKQARQHIEDARIAAEEAAAARALEEQRRVDDELRGHAATRREDQGYVLDRSTGQWRHHISGEVYKG